MINHHYRSDWQCAKPGSFKRKKLLEISRRNNFVLFCAQFSTRCWIMDAPSPATTVFSRCANHSKSRMTVFPYWTRVCVFHSTLLSESIVFEWFIVGSQYLHSTPSSYSFRHLESMESSDGPTTVVRKPANVSRLFCRRTTKYRRHTCVRRARSENQTARPFPETCRTSDDGSRAFLRTAVTARHSHPPTDTAVNTVLSVVESVWDTSLSDLKTVVSVFGKLY